MTRLVLVKAIDRNASGGMRFLQFLRILRILPLDTARGEITHPEGCGFHGFPVAPPEVQKAQRKNKVPQKTQRGYSLDTRASGPIIASAKKDDGGSDKVNICYCDESGTGDEPIAVMVGIVVDSHRMHITKGDWAKLLELLSKIAGKTIAELHTKNFYAGGGIWRDMDGPQRARVLSSIFQWLADRKHHVVYASVEKKKYAANFALQLIPDELNTIWRFLGYHLILAMQRCCQCESKNKGHTMFIFDNQKREELRFADLISRPPQWSDEYYGRKSGQKPLDQVVDIPYFGDSKEVALIQLADVASFFLRRYAEIREGLVPPKYKDEDERVTGWVKQFVERSIGRQHIYRKAGRTEAENLFFDNAPESIRTL